MKHEELCGKKKSKMLGRSFEKGKNGANDFVEVVKSPKEKSCSNETFPINH